MLIFITLSNTSFHFVARFVVQSQCVFQGILLDKSWTSRWGRSKDAQPRFLDIDIEDGWLLLDTRIVGFMDDWWVSWFFGNSTPVLLNGRVMYMGFVS